MFERVSAANLVLSDIVNRLYGHFAEPDRLERRHNMLRIQEVMGVRLRRKGSGSCQVVHKSGFKERPKGRGETNESSEAEELVCLDVFQKINTSAI